MTRIRQRRPVPFVSTKGEESHVEEERIVSPEMEGQAEERLENSLRPQTLDEYIGQNKVKENMKIYIEAAQKRGEPLDHVLLYGPPGLGKTTLSNIISNEMKSNIKITSGPAIEKPGDLASLLTNLSEFDVLFIDEIHRLSKSVEEILYSALEDYTLDIMIGKGPSSRSIRLDLPKFTLIGATTKAGALSTPLRDRFGIVHRLELYSVEDAKKFLKYNNYYFKLKSYARNYNINPKKYYNLDFAYLVELSKLDMYIRKIILELPLDTEHYLKVRLINDLSDNSKEDGYNIVKLFLPYHPNAEADLSGKAEKYTFC